MRILSQDGRIDFPYDTTGLSIWDNHDSENRKFRIYAHMRNQDGSPCILAIYSTEEKAKKAMEMLHSAYILYHSFNVAAPAQKAIILAQTAEDSQIYMYGIFQFQTDEEIEV